LRVFSRGNAWGNSEQKSLRLQPSLKAAAPAGRVARAGPATR
jgi:hypothetical protein